MYTKQQVCNYLINYHHLSCENEIENTDEIIKHIKKVGCIQYDPLDVVGKNPDLVLQSRYRDYIKGDIYSLLYEKRLLFDVWDKNMSICSVEDWAYFERYRNKFLPWCKEYKRAVDEIKLYLNENECASSSDFKMEDRVAWHYGPQRLAKAALECMCYSGLAVVHHKKGTRRYYSLAEKHIPHKFFSMEDPNKNEDDYYKWMILRRINSVGVLWNKPSDAFLGPLKINAANRDKGFKGLLEDGRICEISVEDMKQPLYISTENLRFLDDVKDLLHKECAVKFIAPLDNLLWDRNLIEALFGFSYKWEVYVPENKRKYGYYVLPVINGSNFIGRIEMKTDREAGTLIVKKYWNEKKHNAKTYEEQILNGLVRFCRYNLCTQIKIEDRGFLKPKKIKI